MINFRNNKTLTNSFWIIIERIFSILLTILATSIFARNIGVLNFGNYNFSLSFVNVFIVFSTLGFEVNIMKYLNSNKFKTNEIIFTSFLLRFISGIIIFLLVNTYSIIYFENEISMLVLIFSFELIFHSLEVFDFWIIFKFKSKVTSIIKIIISLTINSLKVLFALYNFDITSFVILHLMSVILFGLSLLLFYFKSNESPIFSFNFTIAKKLFFESFPILVSGLMITIYMEFDKLYLGYYSSTYSVGIYSIATLIGQLWYFVPLSIITSYKNRLFKLHETDLNSFNKLYLFLLSLVFWIGMIFSIGISLFSNLIITIFFGIQFVDAAIPLSILVWAGIFATIGSTRSIWLAAKNKQIFSVYYTFIGLITSIVLNFILVPNFGITGSAISLFFAQFNANMISLIIFKETKDSVILQFKAINPYYIIKGFKQEVL